MNGPVEVGIGHFLDITKNGSGGKEREMANETTIEVKDEQEHADRLEVAREKQSVQMNRSMANSAVLRHQMKVREIMQPKRLLKTAIVILIVFTLYLVLLKFNIDEAKLRTISSKYSSLNSMTDLDSITGQIHPKLEVNVRVLKVDLVGSLIICQISFLTSALISKDRRRLDVPLLAYFGYYQRSYSVNSTMEPIIATFPILAGSNSYYPFDEFYTEILVEITDLNTGQRIPSVVRIKASVPALHFDVARTVQELEGGETTESMEIKKDDSGIDGEVNNYYGRNVQSYRFRLKVRRPFTLILFSIFIIILMWALSLAMSVMAANIVLGLDARPECSFLGQGSALLFALPRLRNVQPDVPPIGIIIDAVGFYWNMAMAAISFAAVLMAWMKRRDYTNTYK